MAVLLRSNVTAQAEDFPGILLGGRTGVADRGGGVGGGVGCGHFEMGSVGFNVVKWPGGG